MYFLTTQIHTRISLKSEKVTIFFKMWRFTAGLGFNITLISFSILFKLGDHFLLQKHQNRDRMI